MKPEGAAGPLGKIAGGSSQLWGLPEQLGWPAARSPCSAELSWEGAGELLRVACAGPPSPCAPTAPGQSPARVQGFCRGSAGVLQGWRAPPARSALRLLGKELLVKAAGDDRRRR